MSKISVLKVDASNNVVPGSQEIFTTAADGPVDLETGLDGDVYYLAINAGELRHIRYVGDNRPPIAAASGQPQRGTGAAHRELLQRRVERPRRRADDHL